MFTKRLSPSVLLLLLAAGLPAQADVPDADGVCDGDEPANVQCEVIAGPTSLTVKSVLSVGIGFCQAETTDLPLQCAGPAGDVNGIGAATFGDAMWAGGRDISINAVSNSAGCTAATSPPCGFTMDICNDRNQNSRCTHPADDMAKTAASEGALGTCKDEKKECADPNEAGWRGCLRESIFADWSDDQIIVFIGTEAGPSLDPPDVQAAVSVDTYTIWVTDHGASNCSGPSQGQLGCIWVPLSVEAGVTQNESVENLFAQVDVPHPQDRYAVQGVLLSATPSSGVCKDGQGDPIDFLCETSTDFLVVLNVGTGSTSATNNSCSAQDPQTASGATPVNVQAATGPGTFNCEFTWVVAGAGACIWI